MTPLSQTPPLSPADELANFVAQASQAAPVAATPPAPAAGIPPEGVEVEIAKPAEAVAKASQQEEASSIQPNPLLADPASVPSQANAITATFNRGQLVQSPTFEERTLFQSALWHGVPVVWNIELCGGGVEVKVRSLPSYALEDIILFWAARRIKDGVSDSAEAKLSLTDYYTALQRAYVFMRVHSISFRTPKGVQTDKFDLEALDKNLLDASTREQSAALLDAWVTERLRTNMNHMRFSLLVEALSVHEQKLCMCLRQASNPNFWQPGTPS